MASSSFCSARQILLLNVILFCGTFFARPSTSDDSIVPTVCQHTRNPSFCSKVLESDPRTKTENPYDLAQVALELAAANASATSLKIESLLLGANDPGLKVIYSECAKYYNDASNAFKTSTFYLRFGQYYGISIAAKVAYTDAFNCEESFNQPPVYKSPLSDDNLNLELLSDIIAVISNVLSNPI